MADQDLTFIPLHLMNFLILHLKQAWQRAELTPLLGLARRSPSRAGLWLGSGLTKLGWARLGSFPIRQLYHVAHIFLPAGVTITICALHPATRADMPL
jgi:hypothetical protein